MSNTKYPAGEYKYTLSIGYANESRSMLINVPEDLGMTIEEWNELIDEEKEDIFQSDWNEWICNYIEGGFYVQD